MEEEEREKFLNGEGCEACDFGKPKKKCGNCYRFGIWGGCEVDGDRAYKSNTECYKLDKFSPRESLRHLFEEGGEEVEATRFQEFLESATDPGATDDPDEMLDRLKFQG